MSIALPEISGLNMLRALKGFGETARLIRDEAGDLSYSRINDMQRDNHSLRAAYSGVMEDVNAGFTFFIVGYLNDRGVPGTAPQINARILALNDAVAAWEAEVLSTAQSLTGGQVIDVRSNALNGHALRTITQKDAIPATQAATIRASAELAALVAALEALGA